MPVGILRSLLQNADVGGCLQVVHFSPYDGCLEKECLKFHVENPSRYIKCLSLTTKLEWASYSEKICAMFLLEDQTD